MTTATEETAAPAASDTGKAAVAAPAAAVPATATPVVATPQSAAVTPAPGSPPAAVVPAVPVVAAPVIPEKYEFKVPEKSPLDAADIAAIEKVAKDGKLTAEAAQKLVDDRHAAVSTFLENRAALSTKARAEWIPDLKADKEFGGDKFDASMQASKNLIDKHGSEMKEYLEASGLGNWPPFVKFCARIAATGREDKIVSASPSAGDRDAAAILFGSTTAKSKP